MAQVVVTTLPSGWVVTDGLAVGGGTPGLTGAPGLTAGGAGAGVGGGAVDRVGDWPAGHGTVSRVPGRVGAGVESALSANAGPAPRVSEITAASSAEVARRVTPVRGAGDVR